MRFKQWPPLLHCWYKLNGILFQQEEIEPFVTYENDQISTSAESKGFLNRVARYGAANNLPEESWSEETISKIILDHLPLSVRSRYVDEAPEADVNFSVRSVLPTAPAPASLLLAAQVQDLLGLSRLTAGKWIGVLSDWKKDYPEEANQKKLSGPVWWWAAHSVALNYENAAMNPEQFVVYWLSLYPCFNCRLKFEKEWITSNPVPAEWEDFKFWISQAHDFVTSHKDS